MKNIIIFAVMTLILAGTGIAFGQEFPAVLGDALSGQIFENIGGDRYIGEDDVKYTYNPATKELTEVMDDASFDAGAELPPSTGNINPNTGTASTGTAQGPINHNGVIYTPVAGTNFWLSQSGVSHTWNGVDFVPVGGVTSPATTTQHGYTPGQLMVGKFQRLGSWDDHDGDYRTPDRLMVVVDNQKAYVNGAQAYKRLKHAASFVNPHDEWSPYLAITYGYESDPNRGRQADQYFEVLHWELIYPETSSR